MRRGLFDLTQGVAGQAASIEAGQRGRRAIDHSRPGTTGWDAARLARDLTVRGLRVVPDFGNRRTPGMMPTLAGVVHGR
jgi:hypothetical protein